MYKSKEIFLRINQRKFYYIKNLLEGYDGLGLISSINNKQGVVRIKYTESQEALLFEFLDSIASDITQ